MHANIFFSLNKSGRVIVWPRVTYAHKYVNADIHSQPPHYISGIRDKKKLQNSRVMVSTILFLNDIMQNSGQMLSAGLTCK